MEAAAAIREAMAAPTPTPAPEKQPCTQAKFGLHVVQKISKDLYKLLPNVAKLFGAKDDYPFCHDLHRNPFVGGQLKSFALSRASGSAALLAAAVLFLSFI